MKISERKRRLRTRGIVPVSQPGGQQQGKATTATAHGRAATKTGRNTPAPPQKRRGWQFSPGQQIMFGAIYVIFSPIMLVQYWVLAHSPKVKVHPGAFEYAMPVIFFLFGLLFIYRGIQGRRSAAAGTPDTKR